MTFTRNSILVKSKHAICSEYYVRYQLCTSQGTVPLVIFCRNILSEYYPINYPAWTLNESRYKALPHWDSRYHFYASADISCILTIISLLNTITFIYVLTYLLNARDSAAYIYLPSMWPFTKKLWLFRCIQNNAVSMTTAKK